MDVWQYTFIIIIIKFVYWHCRSNIEALNQQTEEVSIIVATHDSVLTQQSTHNIIVMYSSSNISHAHALFVYYYDVHVVYMVDV